MNLKLIQTYILIVILTGALFPPHVSLAETGPGPGSIDSVNAFDKLKHLEGQWEGTVGSKQGSATSVSYHVTANGHTVMETLFPGTNHEMVSMYYLDSGELVLTHYCAMGNQPKMKLSRATATELVFDFAGGTNLDPKKEMHIHSGKIVFLGPNQLETEWAVYQGETPTGVHRFFLTRKEK